MTQASTRLQGWAGTAASSCRLIRPGSADELAAEIKAATKAGLSVCPRGGGYSYGDVALNEHNIVCDTSGLDQILAWDPAEGVIDVEPGVPLHKILARVIPENWMLPVVPGTRFPTVGGATSNNVHGKNSFAVGNFGDYVTEVDLLLAGHWAKDLLAAPDKIVSHPVVSLSLQKINCPRSRRPDNLSESLPRV